MALIPLLVEPGSEGSRILCETHTSLGTASVHSQRKWITQPYNAFIEILKV